MVIHSLCLLVNIRNQIALLGLVLLAISTSGLAQSIEMTPGAERQAEQQVVSPQQLEIEQRLLNAEGGETPTGNVELSTDVDLEINRELQRKRNQLEHQISQLEIEFGPYFQNLTEPMLELADVYNALGDQESSLALLDRSLHMVRIQNGLESIEQMPVLQLYANALAGSGEHEKAEAKQFQYFQIAQRTIDSGSDEFMEIMLEMREHHADRFFASREGASVRDLVGAYSLSLNLADALEDKYSVEAIVEEDVVVRTMTVNPEYRDNLLWLMSLDYLLFKFGFHERDPMFRVYSPAIVSRIDAQRSGTYASEAAFFNDPEANYRRGRERAVALVELTAKIEGHGSLEHVLAQVLLGDWYIMFGRRERAAASYTEALELAITPETREPLERIFASPSELPIAKLSIDAFYAKAIEKTGEQSAELNNSEVQRGFIKYSYNLSVSGRATDVEILETNLLEPERALRQELGQMRSSRTRPVFVDSGFVESNGLVKTRYFRRLELRDDTGNPTATEGRIDNIENNADGNLSTIEAADEGIQMRPVIEPSGAESLNIRNQSTLDTNEASGDAL